MSNPESKNWSAESNGDGTFNLNPAPQYPSTTNWDSIDNGDGTFDLFALNSDPAPAPAPEPKNAENSQRIDSNTNEDIAKDIQTDEVVVEKDEDANKDSGVDLHLRDPNAPVAAAAVAGAAAEVIEDTPAEEEEEDSIVEDVELEEESGEELRTRTTQAVIDILQGRKPMDCLNPEVLDKLLAHE
jgi:hypothetical protein